MRKSSSAVVALVGRHHLKVYTRKTEKSLPEAVQRQNCTQQPREHRKRKLVQSMMCDLGFAVKPVLIMDAKATEHTLHRHGIRKMKHIDVAHLLRVRRVKSEDNLAGIGTKAISNKIIRKHATSMVYVDAQENLKAGDVVELWIEESE